MSPPGHLSAGYTLYRTGTKYRAGQKVTELGLERDCLRKGTLVINVSMGVHGEGEESRWAGIYLSDLPSHFR